MVGVQPIGRKAGRGGETITGVARWTCIIAVVGSSDVELLYDECGGGADSTAVWIPKLDVAGSTPVSRSIKFATHRSIPAVSFVPVLGKLPIFAKPSC